jgi:hypothetical protein
MPRDPTIFPFKTNIHLMQIFTKNNALYTPCTYDQNHKSEIHACMY